MNNIEKLQRVLTRELVEKNVDVIARVESMSIGQEKIKDAFDICIATSVINIDYVFSVNEGGVYQPLRNIKLNTSIDLSGLNSTRDSSQEQDVLAYIVYEHISTLENEIKKEIDKINYENKYVKEARVKVQQQFDNKNKFKGEFGFKGEDLYVTASGNKYMNTPHKPEILVTPDGVKFEDNSPTKPIPLEKINLGSLTLQEKDGKLAITYADGFTRYIK